MLIPRPVGIGVWILSTIILGVSPSPAQESRRGVPGFRPGVVRSPGPGIRSQFNAELEPPAAVIPAQFQATIYEVQSGPAKAGGLDGKALARQATTPEALLKAPGEAGKIADPVTDRSTGERPSTTVLKL
jgi:hypothetical protein